MTQIDSIVVVSAKRTPMGGMLGELSNMAAFQLGATAIASAIKTAGLTADKVEEVIMGNVLLAGQGQNPGRQASILAGVPYSAPAATLHKVCGSGMQAIMWAADQLRLGYRTIMVAGGMESMTNAPYLLPKARGGYRLTDGVLVDGMIHDGLQDPYEKLSMGIYAENTAEKYGFTREAMDEFSITSLQRSQTATQAGSFANEIEPVTLKTRKGETVMAQDELPLKAKPEKIPQLKPAFKKDGTVTAANSSSISDGAAAVVLMRESDAVAQGLKPMARIVAQASYSHEPQWFTTAPVGAMKMILDQTNWSVEEVDLFEVNEAFACVTMAAMHDLNLPHEKVNIHGGACALGHPIGASGARIVTTLLHALEKTGGKRGIASLCIGGGEAVAMAFERLV